jgi:hypothetical protein
MRLLRFGRYDKLALREYFINNWIIKHPISCMTLLSTPEKLHVLNLIFIELKSCVFIKEYKDTIHKNIIIL